MWIESRRNIAFEMYCWSILGQYKVWCCSHVRSKKGGRYRESVPFNPLSMMRSSPKRNKDRTLDSKS